MFSTAPQRSRNHYDPVSAWSLALLPEREELRAYIASPRQAAIAESSAVWAMRISSEPLTTLNRSALVSKKLKLVVNPVYAY